MKIYLKCAQRQKTMLRVGFGKRSVGSVAPGWRAISNKIKEKYPYARTDGGDPNTPRARGLAVRVVKMIGALVHGVVSCIRRSGAAVPMWLASYTPLRCLSHSRLAQQYHWRSHGRNCKYSRGGGGSSSAPSLPVRTSPLSSIACSVLFSFWVLV